MVTVITKNSLVGGISCIELIIVLMPIAISNTIAAVSAQKLLSKNAGRLEKYRIKNSSGAVSSSSGSLSDFRVSDITPANRASTSGQPSVA